MGISAGRQSELRRRACKCAGALRVVGRSAQDRLPPAQALTPLRTARNTVRSAVSSFDPTAELLKNVTALAVAAAKAILDCRTDSSVSIKADGSLVTPADETAEMLIRAGLARLAPSVPVLSEERAERPQPAAGTSYFLVDPLDGTREFIACRDEYTVNIGLISG